LTFLRKVNDLSQKEALKSFKVSDHFLDMMINKSKKLCHFKNVLD